MKLLLIVMALLAFNSTSPVHLKGWLSAYDYAPTMGTVAYRQESGELPQDMTKYDGVIAVQDCSLVGTDADLHTISGVFRVIIFDCADHTGSDGTISWMESNDIVAEIGYFLRYWHPEIVHTRVKVVYHAQAPP